MWDGGEKRGAFFFARLMKSLNKELIKLSEVEKWGAR